MVAKVLDRAAKRLLALDGIKGVVLGGSRAKGKYNKDSDIDIGLYYDGTYLKLKDLNLAAKSLDDKKREDLIGEEGSWGPWVNTGGWLTIAGYDVDIILRDIKKVEKAINDTDMGLVIIGYQPGHPHGFLNVMYRGELAISKLLHSPSEDFEKLKNKAQIYPDSLREALIEKFIFEAKFSLSLALSVVGRGDIYYMCGQVFRAISSLNQVLFAINKEYLINEKSALELTNNLPISPEDYRKRVENILFLSNKNTDNISYALKRLEDIILEIENLVIK